MPQTQGRREVGGEPGTTGRVICWGPEAGAGYTPINTGSCGGMWAFRADRQGSPEVARAAQEKLAVPEPRRPAAEILCSAAGLASPPTVKTTGAQLLPRPPGHQP